MQVLTLVNRKGGAGKSVLALNLAVAAKCAGETVAIIDLDPQGTTVSWHESRSLQGPLLIHGLAPGQLRAVVAALAETRVTLVVIDTPGGEAATSEAVQAAHLCLVPVRPCEADVRATYATLQALAAARRPYAIVVNQAPAWTLKVSQEPLGGEDPVLPLAIAARIDHQHAYARGLSVQEYAPAGKAAAEIAELWDLVARRLGKSACLRAGRGAMPQDELPDPDPTRPGRIASGPLPLASGPAKIQRRACAVARRPI